MNTADFEFALAPELIAQQPAAKRDGSRLLRLDRKSGAVRHHGFSDLCGLLRPDDLIVFNDTRVVSARLVGRKPSGGRIEILLVERLDARAGAETWRCLMKGSRKPAAGGRIDFGEGLQAEVLEPDAGGVSVRLRADGGRIAERLEAAGQTPLPPYIRRDNGAAPDADRERYQTVYARHPGAIAAPTAGLHFTPGLLEALRQRGIEQAFLTLHVGLGTFAPVVAAEVEQHRIHRERFEVTEDVACAVDATRRRAGRVVAVGTTVVRALESCARDDGSIAPQRGDCDLFIYPGFRFRVVDALLTNFHLPRSTLLMLVAAFAGREPVLAAYREAVGLRYRFYSYGDAMLIDTDA